MARSAKSSRESWRRPSSAAPPAAEVAKAVTRSLCSAGLAMLGLAPATLFLVASTRSPALVVVFGALVIGGAAVLGLRQLSRLLFAGRALGARAVAVYGAWSSVALILGGKLLSRWGGLS